jgi:hypothetical protein
LRQRLSAATQPVDSRLRRRHNSGCLSGGFFGLEAPFLFFFHFPFHGLPLDLFFFTLGALSLEAGDLQRTARLQGGGRLIGHPHHLIRHTVGLLFVLIAGSVDGEFCLYQSSGRLIAESWLELE